MKSPLVFLATCTQNLDTGTVPVIELAAKLTVFVVAVANSRVENKIKVEII